ncbi:MAG: hypothetical protein JXN61_03115 [Sedimentisphaerales bacterium]|nr:hypothetical protein [Sedimentisphaerales bacterium]
MNSITSKSVTRMSLILCAIFCLCGNTALAAGAGDAPADNAAPEVSIAVSGAPSPLANRLKKTISIEFRKTAIEDVLRIVADQADVDIVKSPKVEGDVTVTLTDVPLEEALNNILSVHGFTYVISENMIRVITNEEQVEKPEVLFTETFEIVYADFDEVVKALEKFKSAKGSVSAIKGTRHVIVTDTETKVRDIKAFIEKIDVMTKQVLVEVRIYDITSEETFDLGVNWHAGRNTPITTIEETDTLTNTTEVIDVGDTGPTSTTTNTRTQTYNNLVDPLNPTADATTNTIATTSGTAGTTSDKTTLKSEDKTIKTTAGTWLSDTYAKSKPFLGGQFDKTDGGTLTFGILNDSVDLQLSLSMLHKQIGAKLLANPRILVLDNETAKIDIVSEIPYQKLNQGGGNQQSFGTTEFKDVGVLLEVTPYIAERDKMIRLKLKPSFSVQTDSVLVGDPSAGVLYPQPVIDKREAETVLLIKDGVTVVMGGLRKSEVTLDIRKVPLLGDLPLLKQLFRSESESTTTSEIIVFITPHIIEVPVMTNQEMDVYEVTKFNTPEPVYTRAEKKSKKK